MSSHKHHPPHTVSRCPHNTRVKRELLLILVRFRMSETSRGPGRHWTGRPVDDQEVDAAIEQNPPTPKKWAPRHRRSRTRPPRDAPETRALERELAPWPPLTALGEGSAGRSIGERAADALLARPKPVSRAARMTGDPARPRPSACATVALGLDGAAEIRRCIPSPSPPASHSPPPSPLRRPSAEKGKSSQNFLRSSSAPFPIL